MEPSIIIQSDEELLQILYYDIPGFYPKGGYKNFRLWDIIVGLLKDRITTSRK